MDEGKKRKREEENQRVKLSFSSKYWEDRFSLLVAELNGSANERGIKEAIVDSVIKEEQDEYTKMFYARGVTGSGEGSSDKSFDPHLSPYSVRTKHALKQRRGTVENQRRGLCHSAPVIWGVQRVLWG